MSDFGKLLHQIEDRRAKIIDQAERVYVDPLKNLADRIEKKLLHEERKKFEKESSKFYSNLEKHLHLSTVRASSRVKNHFLGPKKRLSRSRQSIGPAAKRVL